MSRSLSMSGLVLLSAGLLAAAPHHANAMTMKECGADYQAAKTAGTLNGQDWKAYRTTHCSATAATAVVAPTPAAAPTAAVVAPMPAKPTVAPVATVPVPPSGGPVAHEVPAHAAPAEPVAAGAPVFPDRIDPKYATLKAGTARMKTCDEQYKTNKATGGNAGMKWIQKGGGYYSACSKHLKSA